jgi:hypothetical protein
MSMATGCGAVSGFQRGAAQGEFGRIELVDGDRTVSVL